MQQLRPPRGLRQGSEKLAGGMYLGTQVLTNVARAVVCGLGPRLLRGKDSVFTAVQGTTKAATTSTLGL